jgi:hypothetical protein
VADLARPHHRGLLGAAAARPPTLRVLLSASDLDELAWRLARAEEHHDP